MADNVNPIDPASATPGDQPAGVASFLATTTGKIALGGLLLLVVVGVLAAIFLTFFNGAPGQSGGTSPGVTIKPSASVTETALAPVEPEQASLRDSFTFRPNIFAPTVSLPASSPAAETTVTAPGTNGQPGTPAGPIVPDNTLLLQSIQVVNGANQATLIWNGVTYAVGAGDELSGTPWEVLSISESSVVMLFGDNRITISLGQGITK